MFLKIIRLQGKAYYCTCVMVVIKYPVKECTVTDYFLKKFGMEKCSVIGLKDHVSMVVMKASVVYLTCSIYEKIFYT